MPTKMAIVEFEKCRPELCESGLCAAAQACKRKVLKQEAPGEAPMADPNMCRACSDCVRACPAQAVRIVVQ